MKKLFYTVVGVAYLLVVFTSLYLLAATLFAPTSPFFIRFEQIIFKQHIASAVFFTGLCIAFLPVHLQQLNSAYSTRLKVSGFVIVVLLLLLAASGALLFVIQAGFVRWLLVSVHVFCALLVTWLLLIHARARAAFISMLYVKPIGVLVALLLTIQLFVSPVGVDDDSARRIDLRASHRPLQDNPFVPFVPVASAVSGEPFYPSPTRIAGNKDRLPKTALIPELAAISAELTIAEVESRGFQSSQLIGAGICRNCHQAIVEQWAQSAHRFSSFNNPFYARAIELARSHFDHRRSQWCGGCHDPALLVDGAMLEGIDRTSIAAQAGLTCLACHSISSIDEHAGNGSYTFTGDSPLNEFGSTGHFWIDVIRDAVLINRPAGHKARMKSAFLERSEFCLTCHKVSLARELNDYRWIRGQNEYDAWQNSGIALNQPATWYEPEASRSCQDCHMPRVEVALPDASKKKGRVRNHAFFAANSALPYIRGDRHGLEAVEHFLRDQKLRIDVIALRDQQGQIHYLNNVKQLPAGETLQLDVVVRNLNVGHAFPGGTIDTNESWIELTVKGDDRILYRSGGLDSAGHVDPDAHFYGGVFVDSHSGMIDRRNVFDLRAPVYVNVIPPGAADLARYQLVVPSGIKKLAVIARLQWRKFNRSYTEFVYRDEAGVPDLPITTIAEDNVSIAVDDRAELGTVDSSPDIHWQRINDYGIALFADGETKAARGAFSRVSDRNPKRPNGYVNQARVFMEEGLLEEAQRLLRQARALAPEDGKIRFHQASLLEKQGDIEAAMTAYREVTELYVNNKQLWIRLARLQRINGQPVDSITSLGNALKIDPENYAVYHELYLSYRELAATATDRDDSHNYQITQQELLRAFDYYKKDETVQALTHHARQKNSAINRMSQKIIVHRLVKAAR